MVEASPLAGITDKTGHSQRTPVNDLFESLEPFILIFSCLGTLWFFFLWPVYQRVVLEREWGTILGHVQKDSEQGD